MTESAIIRLQGDPLVLALKDPATLIRLPPREWTGFIRRTRAAVLLPKVAMLAEDAGITGELPDRVQRLFRDAKILFEENQRMLRWEERRVAAALAPLNLRPILLKGGAYILAGLAAGKGRLSSDLDILVPQEQINAAEAALIRSGWEAMKSNEYDDAYYRRWMHELPPLRHKDRRTMVDVHHNILPPTGRLHPDAAPMLAEAVALPGGRSLRLSNADLALHSAAHLAEDGDFRNRLRELFDMHQLLGEFGTEAGFWNELAHRAETLRLWRPIAYSALMSARVFGTELPEGFRRRAKSAVSASARRAVTSLAARIIVPPQDRAPVRGRDLAARLLYMRSHWLRMPPWMLTRHLTIKLVRRVMPGAE